MKRSQFGLWVASSLTLVAVPAIVFADPDNHDSDSKDGNHDEPATTAQSISHNWTIDYQSADVAQDKWGEKWPQNGTAMFLIDYKGNWLMSGNFPPQPHMKYSNESTVGVGIKSKALDNQIIAFVHKLKITKDGGSFSHQGTDPIIGDLWKNIASGKGHKWHSASHTYELKPKPAPNTGSSGGAKSNGGNSGNKGGGGIIGDVTGAAQDGINGVNDVVNDIGNALGGAVSDVISWL